MVGFMPRAMRVDRLLSEHGIGQDSAVGRQEFERQMERRRLEAIDEEALKRPCLFPEAEERMC